MPNEPNDGFDYGKKLPSGQFENYPINMDGEFKAPIRNEYMHTICGASTKMTNGLALTYARHPGKTYYSHTYCIRCKDHLPLEEFVWVEYGKVTSVKMSDMLNLGSKGKPGEDMTGLWKLGEGP